MPHKAWKLLLSFWATSLALAIGTLFTLAADNPDFSNWKNHGAFEKEFAKLLRDLRATEA